MIFFLFIVGVAGILFCGAFGPKIDAIYLLLVSLFKQRTLPENFSSELELTRELLRQLRSGIALETAVNKIRATFPDTHQKSILDQVLTRKPNHSLAQILLIAIESGCSILGPLSIYAENLQKVLQIKAKIRALTSQARAQATVLSYLPLLLLVALAFLDLQNFFLLLRMSETALLGALLLFFLGGGKFWIDSLQTKLLNSTSTREDIEYEIVPKFALQWALFLSAGIDSQTAYEKCERQIPNEKVVAFAESDRGKFFQHILEQSVHAGAPIKDELLKFLEEHLHSLHYQWEEKAHRLPVKLLAPLFLCFLPACLLALTIFFIPLWRQI